MIAFRALAAVACLATPFDGEATVPAPESMHSLPLGDGRTLTYRLDKPDGFDPTQPVPVLLALPPGGMDRAMVDRAAELYWADAGRRRGWVVVAPATPGERGDRVALAKALPALVESLSSNLTIAGGRVHLAGVSNGGRTAFAASLASPKMFASLTVLPGFPQESADLSRLTELPVNMFVGGDDEDWLERMSAVRGELVAAGNSQVALEVLEGEGHTPKSLTGERLFDVLATARIHSRLDELHAAAAEARLSDYEACFSKDAVFFGTDAAERWSRAELIDYARPIFDSGRGWTYAPRERSVQLGPSSEIAWFDERLDHAKYGELRGTGVLRRAGTRWLVVQYNLAFTVPNAVADKFVEMTTRR